MSSRCTLSFKIAWQVKKFQEKVEKCRKEVDLTRDIYRASLSELNSSNSKYIEEMTEVFSKAQDFESKRLSFNKKLFYNIHSCLDLSNNKQ
jgi:protein kinase C and casein kinase substrate in neurons protein